MNLFLDTSAIVKLYHREDGTDDLINFLIRFPPDLVLTISDLTFIEFRSVFFRRLRLNEIDLDTTKQVIYNFENDTELMNVIEIDRLIKERARQLIINHGSTKHIRTLDSIQLASAIVANEILTIDYFVAADKQLLEIAESYFSTYNPAKLQAMK